MRAFKICERSVIRAILEKYRTNVYIDQGEGHLKWREYKPEAQASGFYGKIDRLGCASGLYPNTKTGTGATSRAYPMGLGKTHPDRFGGQVGSNVAILRIIQFQGPNKTIKSSFPSIPCGRVPWTIVDRTGTNEMNMTLDIAFWHPDQHVQIECTERDFHLGTSAGTSLAVPGCEPDQQPSIAVSVSEDGLRLTIRNESAMAISSIWDPKQIAAGQTALIELPCLLKVATHFIELRCRRMDQDQVASYSVLYERNQDGAAIPAGLLGRAPSSDTLASWFNALSVLQRAAATSPEFYDLAVRAIDHPGGLDRGLVLLHRNDAIVIAASAQNDPHLGLTYRHDLVTEAIAHGRTLISNGSGSSASARSEDAVVVAPIFGPDDIAIGAVYGVRSLHASNQRSTIRPLEALWVQLVAEAVGGGIQRVTAEMMAARTRLMFEQVFSPALVDELLRNTDALRPQQREITVLFCDLRDSTALGQRLEPQTMYQLLGEILERLTAKVSESGGVIIDYYGDGLAAMWNAPHDQPDHAMLACQAAVAMVGQVNVINRKYQNQIGQPLRLGIGIHTDVAFVGNAGSSQRLKYGPRGHMVALASRLETATKRIKTPILVSSNTKKQIEDRADIRGLCHARLRGIAAPVELFELRGLHPDRQRQRLMHEIDSMESVLDCIGEDALQDADLALLAIESLDGRDHQNNNGDTNRTARQQDQKSVRVVDLTRL